MNFFQKNLIKPTLLLFLAQLIIGVTVGALIFLLTDVLKMIPNSSSLNQSSTIAGIWLSGYIFGYWYEKKYPSFLVKKINKLSIIVTLIWILVTAPLVLFLYSSEEMIHSAIFWLLLLMIFIFINYIFTNMSIKNGIKVRKKIVLKNQ